MKKKELEILLEKIEKPKNVKVHLEQYTTPACIAADILWLAFYNGDIKDKIVIDLGCGNGIFSIGAAMLNAKKVIGIDIDEDLISIAKKEAEKFGVDIEFLVMDIEEFCGRGDVVIMNPPFGAQHPNRKADQKFLKKAIEISNTIYSLHLKDSLDFIQKLIEKEGWKIIQKKEYKFPIKSIFPFYKKEVFYCNVVMINALKYSSNYKSN